MSIDRSLFIGSFYDWHHVVWCCQGCPPYIRAQKRGADQIRNKVSSIERHIGCARASAKEIRRRKDLTTRHLGSMKSYNANMRKGGRSNWRPKKKKKREENWRPSVSAVCIMYDNSFENPCLIWLLFFFPFRPTYVAQSASLWTIKWCVHGNLLISIMQTRHKEKKTEKKWAAVE